MGDYEVKTNPAFFQLHIWDQHFFLVLVGPVYYYYFFFGWRQSSLLNTGCAKTCLFINALYFLCFAFIYFCYSILTTLWNKVHSNFDPSYFCLATGGPGFVCKTFSVLLFFVKSTQLENECYLISNIPVRFNQMIICVTSITIPLKVLQHDDPTVYMFVEY